jgi:hypothetical protein
LLPDTRLSHQEQNWGELPAVEGLEERLSGRLVAEYGGQRHSEI